VAAPEPLQNHFFPRDEEAAELALYRVALERLPCGYTVERVARSNQVLFHVRRGAARFRAGERVFDLQPGMLFTFVADSPHAIQQVLEPLEVIRVVFTGRGAAQAMRRLTGGRGSWAWQERPDAGVDRWFEELLAHSGRLQQSHGVTIALHLLRILLLAAQIEASEGWGTIPAAERTYLRACHEMERRMFAPQGCLEVAEACGISAGYLVRLFHRFAKCRPSEYLARIRMEYAKEHLMETDETLAQIAERFGYADAFAFSKAYKRRMGEAPSRVRERMTR